MRWAGTCKMASEERVEAADLLGKCVQHTAWDELVSG